MMVLFVLGVVPGTPIRELIVSGILKAAIICPTSFLFYILVYHSTIEAAQ